MLLSYVIASRVLISSIEFLESVLVLCRKFATRLFHFALYLVGSVNEDPWYYTPTSSGEEMGRMYRQASRYKLVLLKVLRLRDIVTCMSESCKNMILCYSYKRPIVLPKHPQC